jgi:hypothetical protein
MGERFTDRLAHPPAVVRCERADRPTNAALDLSAPTLSGMTGKGAVGFANPPNARFRELKARATFAPAFGADGSAWVAG